MPATDIHTECCIVGGGPAGVMLGYLLARSGVPVTILEKHKDFFRDFRGDTVHPATLELMWELGLLDEFLKVPHQKVTAAGVTLGDESFQVASFAKLKTHCRFIAIMPQWDFLNFLAEQGRKYAGFDLRMEHEATGILQDGARVSGVRVKTPEGEIEIAAKLVIACDGRHSIVRDAAQLPLKEFGVPMDVLWFHLGHNGPAPEQVLGYINYGKMLVVIDRRTYYQAGLIIQKGSFEEVKARGLEAFRQSIVEVAPFLEESVRELKDWDQVKLLSVQLNRLARWHRPGLLCIGDAAHAMSPVFGIGVNLAVQDAAATANILAPALLAGQNTDAVLGKVQAHRELRTVLIQGLQALAHRNFKYIFRPGPLRVSAIARFILRSRLPQPILMRVIGQGIVPEHIDLPGLRHRPADRTARRVGAAIGVAVGLAWAFTKCRRKAIA